jgi:hypothetical protein
MQEVGTAMSSLIIIQSKGGQRLPLSELYGGILVIFIGTVKTWIMPARLALFGKLSNKIELRYQHCYDTREDFLPG